MACVFCGSDDAPIEAPTFRRGTRVNWCTTCFVKRLANEREYLSRVDVDVAWFWRMLSKWKKKLPTRSYAADNVYSRMVCWKVAERLGNVSIQYVEDKGTTWMVLTLHRRQ